MERISPVEGEGLEPSVPVRGTTLFATAPARPPGNSLPHYTRSRQRGRHHGQGSEKIESGGEEAQEIGGGEIQERGHFDFHPGSGRLVPGSRQQGRQRLMPSP